MPNSQDNETAKRIDPALNKKLTIENKNVSLENCEKRNDEKTTAKSNVISLKKCEGRSYDDVPDLGKQFSPIASVVRVELEKKVHSSWPTSGHIFRLFMRWCEVNWPGEGEKRLCIFPHSKATNLHQNIGCTNLRAKFSPNTSSPRWEFLRKKFENYRFPDSHHSNLTNPEHQTSGAQRPGMRKQPEKFDLDPSSTG